MTSPDPDTVITVFRDPHADLLTRLEGKGYDAYEGDLTRRPANGTNNGWIASGYTAEHAYRRAARFIRRRDRAIHDITHPALTRKATPHADA